VRVSVKNTPETVRSPESIERADKDLQLGPYLGFTGSEPRTLLPLGVVIVLVIFIVVLVIKVIVVEVFVVLVVGKLFLVEV